MRDTFRGLAEKLLWSVWSELGVPGGGRLHTHLVLDPEPIIAFTPFLAQHDARLLGLAFDWCAHNAKHLSPSRLAGIGRMLSPLARQHLEGFNGALLSQGVSWRPQGEPSLLEVHRKAMALPTERHALLNFRIRALTGVSARADVLCRMLFLSTTGATTTQLTPPGTTRRAVEDVVNDLTASGLVAIHGSLRKRRFALHDHVKFSRFFQSEGLQWWDWWTVLQFIEQLQSIPLIQQQSARLQRIEALRLRETCAALAADLGVPSPPQLAKLEDPLAALADWGHDQAVMFTEDHRKTTKTERPSHKRK